MATSTPQHPLFPSQGWICWQSPVDLVWGETHTPQQMAVYPQTVMILVLLHFAACESPEKQEDGCFILFLNSTKVKKMGMEEHLLLQYWLYINQLVWKFLSWNILFTLWKTNYLVLIFFWAKVKAIVSQSSWRFGVGGIYFVSFLGNNGNWGADFNHASLEYQFRIAPKKGAVFWTCFPSKLRRKSCLARLSQLQLEALERTHRHPVEKLQTQENQRAKTRTRHAQTHGCSPQPPHTLTTQGKWVPCLETVLYPLSQSSFIPLLPNYGHIENYGHTENLHEIP